MTAVLLAACVTREPAEPPVETIALPAVVDTKFAVPASAVTASGHDGNVPGNTVDGRLSTRWSALGDGQWIRYDLGGSSRVASVKIAFYNGASRTNRFDIQTSPTGAVWTNALTGGASARNDQLQTFEFADVNEVRYVRILGHGNSSNLWNSFTEVEIHGGPATCAPDANRCTAAGRESCADGQWVSDPCDPGTTCTGGGMCTTTCTTGAARCLASGAREVCSNNTWLTSPCAPGTLCTGAGMCVADTCGGVAAKCSGTNRLVCVNGVFITQNCAFGTICTGQGDCTPSTCTDGEAKCNGTSRLECVNGVFITRNCAFGSICTGQGECTSSTCTDGEAKCNGTSRLECVNGVFITRNCAFGTVCSGQGMCTVDESVCPVGGQRCTATGREVCDHNQWVASPCATGTVCTGAGMCTLPPPAISGLTVNDTSGGNDGIANNTQWSIQAGFGGGAGQRPFADRAFTLAALPAAASHLAGKAWIRTAADSKSYTATATLATATVTGSTVYLAVDSRHSTTFLTTAGFTQETYSLTVMEGTTARPYRVWKKAVLSSGAAFSFPRVGATIAPCYFAIVQ